MKSSIVSLEWNACLHVKIAVHWGTLRQHGRRYCVGTRSFLLVRIELVNVTEPWAAYVYGSRSSCHN